ncbi:MAG TPA: hypothetical protein VNW06_04290 [Cytophagaceae bacterium]|jgi:hypothetical protein|nr:hypothetical protein [Cytophagaceae bacterium]
MKKITVIFSCAAIIGFVACESQEKMEAQSSRKELNHYIDSVRGVTPEYTNNYWVNVDEGYRMRVEKAELAAKEEQEKKDIEKSKADYQELKSKYEANVAKNNEQVALTQKQALRNALFGEGKINTDVNFNWVTAANIKGVYENFVNTVDANKKMYTREDWDEVKFLYEALDTRKNEVEKELPSKDNMKIAKEKIRFASIESIDRPLSKVSENSEAKKQ